MKEWFRARNLWGAAILTLEDEDAGRLMKALWTYTMTGCQAELQGPEKSIFALILLTLNQDEAYDVEISNKRSVCGSAGGRPRKAKANAYPDLIAETGKVIALADAIEEAKKANAFPDAIAETEKANALFAFDEKAKKAIAPNKNKNKSNNKNKSIEKEQEEKERSFARFWDAYPLHVSRQEAEREFARLNPDEALLETMLKAIERWKQTEQWREDGGRYIPHPSTWLYRKRWEDEVPAAGKRKPTVTAQQYEQRDYSLVQAEIEAELEREMEEYMRAERMKQESAINNSEQGIKTESECENI